MNTISENQLRSIIRKILSEQLKVVDDTEGDPAYRESEEEVDIGGVLAPDSSASIKGKEFIVHGVKFQSVPAEGAGNVAAALYQSAEKAGQKSASGPWEATKTGRSWVSQNIYDASKTGSGAEWSDKLGTKNESHWSSWFFSVCYKGFGGEGGHG